MKLRTIIVTLGLTAASVVAAPAMAAHASCGTGPETVVTHLANRPDGGHHGTWALDAITRTTTISTVETPDDDTWTYKAVVTDTGTFKTLGGEHLSPNKGVALKAGTAGTITGGFTVDFTAPACFGGYQGNLADSYTDTKPAGTSEWVGKVWGGEGLTITTNLDANYSWTYQTCGGQGETWVDAYNNDDGQADGAGDIVGCTCPTPTPTATATPTPTATPTATATVAPIVLPTSARSSSAAAAALPVTGSSTWLMVGGGLALLAAGVLLYVTTRRRHTTFEA